MISERNVCIKVAGRLKYFLSEWKLITTDHKILGMVQHCHLEFIELPSPQYKRGLNYGR